jgi:hypothetical protein
MLSYGNFHVDSFYDNIDSYDYDDSYDDDNDVCEYVNMPAD